MEDKTYQQIMEYPKLNSRIEWVDKHKAWFINIVSSNSSESMITHTLLSFLKLVLCYCDLSRWYHILNKKLISGLKNSFNMLKSKCM